MPRRRIRVPAVALTMLAIPDVPAATGPSVKDAKNSLRHHRCRQFPPRHIVIHTLSVSVVETDRCLDLEWHRRSGPLPPGSVAARARRRLIELGSLAAVSGRAQGSRVLGLGFRHSVPPLVHLRSGQIPRGGVMSRSSRTSQRPGFHLA